MARFFRRRKYIVDRELQFDLVRAHLILFGTSLGFLAVGIFAPLVTELNGPVLPEDQMLTAATMMLYMHERMWLLFALTSVFLILGLLRLSHKIAGPLYRFRRVVSEAKAGVPTRDIRLRRGDFLHQEAKLLSQLIADMTEQADMLRRTGREVNTLREKIIATPGLRRTVQKEILDELARMQANLESAGEWSSRG